MKTIQLIQFASACLLALPAFAQPELPVTVGAYPQELRLFYSADDGLPSNDVHAIAIGDFGTVYAGTSEGLAAFKDGAWSPVQPFTAGPVTAMAMTRSGWLNVHFDYPTSKNSLVGMDQKGVLVYDGSLYGLDGVRLAGLPVSARGESAQYSLAVGNGVVLGTTEGLYVLNRDKNSGKYLFIPVEDLNYLLYPSRVIHAVALGPNREFVVGCESGLYHGENLEQWYQVLPQHDDQSWAPTKVHAVGYSPSGALWFASPQGVGRLTSSWELFTGEDGLPYNDFTSLSVLSDDRVWFGTRIGAIRFDGEDFSYRQGKRWLPDDDVRDVVVTDRGGAWTATSYGVSHIAFQELTLAEKAAFYETEIDERHRRTPLGYVLQVTVNRPGDRSEWTNHDSDNDGLWTSMYGAAQCFAYAATNDPKAKERADNAFYAMNFLRTVTQGTENSPPKGYVARTILPTSGPDPNIGRIERDQREKDEDDALWKVIDPRWPVSADGKWYWKCDTSSDELDGHFFFYGLYYDLVAESEDEKRRVRTHVQEIADHLVDHNFNLVDHDGKPTRWARYSPEELNHDKNWFVERGLNSLSILSYLAVAEHITGDEKFAEAARYLVEEHGYEQNLMYPKHQRGAGAGNQSDDEMAFMCYYSLLRYEDDPELRERVLLSFNNYWRLEQPELNPFFNFAYAAYGRDATFHDAWGAHDLSPGGDWLSDSVVVLKGFPLDRFNWGHRNSHRTDIVLLPNWSNLFDRRDVTGRGHRTNGKVLPVEERHFEHWNTDPWRLDYGGDGRVLADGTVFLLPYYMGLYHEFVK